jgi:hypothetical protein
MLSSAATYDADFHAWAEEQAALLRSGKLAELDVAHLAEEIEALGRSERRELVHRLEVLLLHLLKWQFQSELRGKSWRVTIDEQRRALADHLGDNPSLRSYQPEAMRKAYAVAIIRAERETNLLRDMFPWACPYTAEQVSDPDYWPEPV